MSLDLFRPAAASRPPRRSRYLMMPLSVITHLAILGALVVIPLTAADTLPSPREMLIVMQAATPAPPPPPPLPQATRAAARVAVTPSVPVEAPEEIGEERGLQPPPDLQPLDLVSYAGTVPGTVDSSLARIMDRPPDPPRPPATPLPIGGKITAPRKLVEARPVYPPLALQAHVEGIVFIRAIIGPTGMVENAEVLRGVPLLNEAALDAVRQWRYTPTQLDGVPISVIMTVTVTFTLK